MNTRRTTVAAIALLFLLMLNGCKERIPPTNTSAFNRLHGIVNDGKTANEITLINGYNKNQPRLMFPPEVAVNVITPGTHDPDPTPIRKGYADSASISLEFTKQKQLIPIVRTPNHLVYDSIFIRFIAGRSPSNIQRTEARLREIAELSVRTTDRPELGLREYVLVTPKTGDISRVEFVPMDEDFHSTDGGRMWIGCHATGPIAELANRLIDPALYHCASNFNYRNAINVAYVFEPKLLPYWRNIYPEVVKLTDSVLIK
jgi:hypothetical protein